MASLVDIANRWTYARAKAAAMGFTLSRIKFEEREDRFGGFAELRCNFVCVCGTPESFARRFLLHEIERARRDPGYAKAMLDPARLLFHHGSFSESHLIDDGFTKEKVAEILQKGKEFDEELQQEGFGRSIGSYPSEYR